ncbi:MAG: pyrroline-5-carboxylate reductase dimerization domain-containing protein, partial [Planctomycetota bacterium]
MASHRLAVIGAGNMGSAVLDGALDAGVLTPSDVLVIDPSASTRRRYTDQGCAAAESLPDPNAAEQLLFAVKPQVFPAVAGQIGALSTSKVVISVMAGLSSGTMRIALGDQARIVRVMPNTPSRIREGMSAIALGDGAHDGDDALAMALFGAIGRTVRVDEAHMYAVTAVSGSGPAYVFRLAEAMEQAAIDVGLEPATARALVVQTVRGAGMLL